MKNTVTLLRHAESVFNAEPSSQQRDCGLSELGRAQAAALRAELRESYDWIACSPLKRAQETLALSGLTARNGVLVWDCLREWRQDPCDFMDSDVTDALETEHEALERVELLRSKLSQLQGRVLLVGHGDFFWLCTSTVRNGDRFGTWLRNAETTEWALL